MKSIKYRLSITIAVIIIIFIPVKKGFSWDMVDLILKTKGSEKIFIPAENNNPNSNFSFLPPIENKDFFESVNDLSICRNANVRKYIYLYLTDGRNYLDTAILRSQRYLPIIEDIFNKNKDMPKDISLLPLLESAFNPYAVSRSRAVGLWQFVKRTSKDLSLKVNAWVDERRDIEKSTAAAIIHLRNLYGIFQSWELALAAYNGGAGYVKFAMHKSHSKNISELLAYKSLNREVKEYIYRFAALLVIYKNQSLFDVENTGTALETAYVELQYPVKISQVAELTGVPLSTLRMFNPELNKDLTPPYETIYVLRLPKDSIERYEQIKTQLFEINYKAIKRHIVRKGECIGKIAKFYNSEIKKIMFINGLKDANSIKPGLELYIPI